MFCLPAKGRFSSRVTSRNPFFSVFTGRTMDAEEIEERAVNARRYNKVSWYAEQKVIEDAADERIHCDERRLRSKVVESPMKGFLKKVCDFLEKFGVKLFAIRYVLHQHLTTRNVALVDERRSFRRCAHNL